jgi:hypothetical protein
MPSASMLDSKHILGALASFFCVVLFGSLALAWPGYRQVLSIDREIADLRGRTEMLDASTAEVERLEARLHEARRKVGEELKIIADSPDLADVMRRLSLPVDEDTVIDQTFTAGSPFAMVLPGATTAEPTVGDRPMAVPVTIELSGTFESLFAILAAAESMDRLIRIGTLRVTCDRSERNSSRQQPILTSSIGLEAVYAERRGARR